MKHGNSVTRAFLPNSCSLRTVSIISVVKRCAPFLQQQSLSLAVGAGSGTDYLEKGLTCLCYEEDAAIVPALDPVLFVRKF